MPLFVVLQTIEGKRLDEAVPPAGALNRLLPFGDASFPLLGFVDPYGNTFFNGTQMQVFLLEWDLLARRVIDNEESEFLGRIRGMAERCKSQPHIFLRFIGD
jgi:hypothetical protein